MSTKHTPGPWLKAKYKVSDIDGALVAHTRSGVMCSVHDEANARLIAAAPDLLAALEKVWSEGVIPDGFALLQDQVCDAIAKATGSAA